MGKMIELTASDGHRLAAYRAEPTGKPRGGIVVIQEIFGVNSHVKSVADGFAKDGYLAIAPAMFDRVQRNFDVGYTPEDIAKGRELRPKITLDMAMKDTQAAVNEAKKAGKVGIVGYARSTPESRAAPCPTDCHCCGRHPAPRSAGRRANRGSRGTARRNRDGRPGAGSRPYRP